MTPTLVLASSSSYRADLLRRLRLLFLSDSPSLDESAEPDEVPRATAIRLARAKALVVAARHPGTVVIGSDQLAERDGLALGKPGTLEGAQQQLIDNSGREVIFHTALCVWDDRRQEALEACVPCHVLYRVLTPQQITRYLAEEPAVDCAGATRIESLGISLARHVRCDDPTALIGLPLITLVDFLQRCGFDIP